MSWIMIMFILLLISCRSVIVMKEYLISNYDLKPVLLIGNSTSISKLLCTKEIDDDQDFGITTMPIISSDDLSIYENSLNDTTMEITIDSSGYIGAFYLICSAIDNQSVGIRSDVFIGAPPGEFTHIDRCIVYENKYIDCVIQAPILVAAILNQYPYTFNFTQIHQSLVVDDAYKQPPEIVETDEVNKTITFRWWPVNTGIFPWGLKMLISGTLRYFGSTNLIIDMTPSFSIKTNFTVKVLSSNYMQVHFNHEIYSFPLVCRGSVTMNENKRNQEEDVRIFREINPTIIDITHLTSNTWYKICFQCRRNVSIDPISEILCIREQTKQSYHWLKYLIIPGIVVIGAIVGGIIYTICSPENYVKKGITNWRNSRRNKNTPTVIELQRLNSNAIEPMILSLSLPLTTEDNTQEITNS